MISSLRLRKVVRLAATSAVAGAAVAVVFLGAPADAAVVARAASRGI